MESAYSVINYNPTTKEQAEKFALKLISEVKSGEVNPLELHVKLTAMQKAMDQVKKEIGALTLQEAEKHGAKMFEAYSSKIEIYELGTKYDFSNCNDPEWVEAKQKEDEAAEKRKERETLLRSVKGSLEIVIPGTGEIAKVYPPTKSSTTGIKVTLK
ncbi:MAG TPA: hypothetical protein VJY62_02590 [Bacteroidia bacterium]|nr:hypothetical protein [Bacteroidia bacterium]